MPTALRTDPPCPGALTRPFQSQSLPDAIEMESLVTSHPIHMLMHRSAANLHLLILCLATSLNSLIGFCSFCGLFRFSIYKMTSSANRDNCASVPMHMLSTSFPCLTALARTSGACGTAVMTVDVLVLFLVLEAKPPVSAVECDVSSGCSVDASSG